METSKRDSKWGWKASFLSSELSFKSGSHSSFSILSDSLIADSIRIQQGMWYFALATALNTLCLGTIYATLNQMMTQMFVSFAAVIPGIVACRAFQGELSRSLTAGKKNLTNLPIFSLCPLRSSTERILSTNNFWASTLDQIQRRRQLKKSWRRFRHDFRTGT